MDRFSIDYDISRLLLRPPGNEIEIQIIIFFAEIADMSLRIKDLLLVSIILNQKVLFVFYFIVQFKIRLLVAIDTDIEA